MKLAPNAESQQNCKKNSGSARRKTATCCALLLGAALCGTTVHTAGGVTAVCRQTPTRQITAAYTRRGNFSYTAEGTQRTSPAFDFHVFAKEICLDAPAYGPLAAETLNGGGQPFGAADKPEQISYFGTFVQNTGACAGGSLVLGTGIPLTAFDEAGTQFIVGETGAVQSVAQSGNVYQLSAGSALYLDIAAELDNLKGLSAALAQNLTTPGLQLEDTGSENRTVRLTSSAPVQYLTVTAQQLGNYDTSRVITFGTQEEPLAGRVVIVNVDMAGAPAGALAQLGSLVAGAAPEEGVPNTPCPVLWNLYDSSRPDTVLAGQPDVPVQAGTGAACFAGSVLAPGAWVQYGGVWGSIVAKKASSSGKVSYLWELQASCQPVPGTAQTTPDAAQKGNLCVTVTLADTGQPATKETVFYLALFTRTEENGTVRYTRVAQQDVKEARFSQPGTQEILFTGLGLGTDYYLFETKADGVLFTGGESTAATMAYQAEGLPQGALRWVKNGQTLYATIVNTPLKKKDASVVAFSGHVSLLERDSQPLTAGEFVFRMQQQEETGFSSVIASGSNAADGSFVIENVPYDTTKPATVYKLTQGVSQSAGISVDTDYYLITVTRQGEADAYVPVVTGVERYHPDGTRTEEAASRLQSIEFVNRYRPQPSKAVITGTFAMEEPMPDGTAMLELCTPDGTQVLRLATNTGNSFSFASILIEKAGTQEYLLRQQPQMPAWYDDTLYVVSLVSTEQNGALQTQVLYRALGQSQSTGTLVLSPGTNPESTPVTASLTLTERAQTAAAVPVTDACYRLARTSGSQPYWAGNNTWTEDPQQAATLKTGEDGAFTIEDLPAGKYVLQQVQPAPGYVADTTPVEAVIALNVTAGTAKDTAVTHRSRPVLEIQELAAPAGSDAIAPATRAKQNHQRFVFGLQVFVVISTGAAWLVLRSCRLHRVRRR